MRNFCFILMLALPVSAYADYSEHPKATELLRLLAVEDRFTAAEIQDVRDALREARRIPKLIEAEQKSAEKVETWSTYSAKRVDRTRIALGAKFIARHHETLARAESRYGVPPSIIAGVLGLETNFGGFTGKTRVLDALTTQGLEHPRRSAFFFSELRNYFVFCRDFGIAPESPKGSYAGAMGWAQFMPSNYRRLAVDFDGDGDRDLWEPVDAIGSIGRYLVEYDRARAWRRGEPVMVRATVRGKLGPSVPVNLKQVTHRAAELTALGIEPEVALEPDTAVGIIKLKLDAGYEYWLGFHNFYSVMSYNPRVYYAMTVSQLAHEMALLAEQEQNLSE